MPTISFFDGFEHGVASISGTGLFTSITTAGTTVQNVTTGTPRSGSYHLKLAPTASAAAFARRDTAASQTRLVYKGWLKFDTLPASGEVITLKINAASGSNYRIHVTSAGLVKLVHPTATINGPTISAGNWVEIDIDINIVANPHVVAWKVDGVDQTGASPAVALSTWQYVFWGTDVAAGPAATFYWDDVAWSHTAADYPLATTNKAIKLSPTSDGSHTNEGNFSNTAGAINSSTNPAYVNLDDVFATGSTNPSTANEFVKQTSITSSVLEFGMENMPEAGTVHAVRGLLDYGGPSATAHTGSTYVIDNAATETAIHGTSSAPADMSELTHFFKSAMITVPSGGWDTTKVDALKMYIGKSGDVTPNPHWQAIMLQVYYEPETDITTTKTQTGVSRVQLVTPRTQTGVSRITQVVARTQAGLARIQKIVSQLQTAVSRIQLVTNKTQTGVSRLQVTTLKTQTGVAKISTALYSRESKATLPTTNAELATVYSDSQITDVGTDNDVFVTLNTASAQFGINQVHKMNANITDNIVVTWKGKTTLATSTKTAFLQIYNFTTPGWETLDSDNVTAAGTEFTLTGTQSTGHSNYYNGNKFVTVRVYQENL